MALKTYGDRELEKTGAVERQKKKAQLLLEDDKEQKQLLETGQ